MFRQHLFIYLYHLNSMTYCGHWATSRWLIVDISQLQYIENNFKKYIKPKTKKYLPRGGKIFKILFYKKAC